MRTWLARLERLSASPGEVRAMAQTFGANDIRADLPELNVPTLILHRAGDRMIDVRHSRFIAERVPGARYVELEGIDNLPSSGDAGAVLGEIEEFLTGGRSRSVERALLTVLFSDIVGSTAHAARMGDAALARGCSPPTTPPSGASSTASAAARSRRSATRSWRRSRARRRPRCAARARSSARSRRSGSSCAWACTPASAR